MLTAILEIKCFNDPHFTDKETELGHVEMRSLAQGLVGKNLQSLVSYSGVLMLELALLLLKQKSLGQLKKSFLLSLTYAASSKQVLKETLDFRMFFYIRICAEWKLPCRAWTQWITGFFQYAGGFEVPRLHSNH